MRGLLDLAAAVMLAAMLTPTAGVAQTSSTEDENAREIILKCYFDWVCDPNRKCQDAGENIRFRVNVAENTVSRIGGDPLSKFMLVPGDRALTILERPISGGVSTTTMMLTGGGDAVHSENAVTVRTLTPMQYLGTCTGV